MKDKSQTIEKSVALKDKIICIAVPILIIIIYLINQALGYGNIAVAQGSEGIKTTYLSSCLTGLGTGLELVALMKLITF